MSARHKLNARNFCGVLIISGIIGLATGSGLAFTVATGGLLVAAVVSGEIRLR